MKKIYMTIALVLCVVCAVQACSVTSFAVESDDIVYDIRIETLDISDDAKELNKYRKAVLKKLRYSTRYHIAASGNDSYTYLTLDDLDFTDSSKVMGMRSYGSYHRDESDVSYEDFMRIVDNGTVSWLIFIEKDNTQYLFNISKYSEESSNTSMISEIGGGWYISKLADVTIINEINAEFFYPKYYIDRNVIESNMKRLLKEEQEKGTDIKLVWTRIGVGQIPYIVFVNGKAKYIYDFGLDFPDYGENTPKVVADVIDEVTHEMWNNCKTGDPYKMDSLYSYNEVMAIMRLISYYSAA